jgi:hypothetical protein
MTATPRGSFRAWFRFFGPKTGTRRGNRNQARKHTEG